MPASPAIVLCLFALTLFVSASLLFIIEPMVGKMITPLLGGTPAVWNTCMVFYQAALLAGYAYAHAATAWLGARKQAVLQLVLLALPFLFLGRLHITGSQIAAGAENPVPALLLLLTTTIGVPFFVISSSAPVLQKWFASTDHPAAADPYFLYGASNLGSMLALFGYPVLIEPNLTLAQQRLAWCVGYGLLVVLTALCAAFLWKSAPAKSAPAVPPPKGRSPRGDEPVPAALSGQVGWARRGRWVLLAAVPSSLMLGATTYMTTDIAAIPLLWVLPLGLYLLTFIIVFARLSARQQNFIVWLKGVAILLGLAYFAKVHFQDADSTRAQVVWGIIGAAALAGLGASFLLFRNRDENFLHRVMVLAMPLVVLLVLFLNLSEVIKRSEIAVSIALHLAALYAVAMVCHGELARDRPDTAHLTEFFLWMSFGGVVGGLFNALVAPVAFNAIIEYPLAMFLACLLVPPLSEEERDSGWGVLADLGLALAFVVTGLILLYLRWRDGNFDLADRFTGRQLAWPAAALLFGLALGLAGVYRRGLRRAPAWLDLVLPLSLGVLVVGLYFGLNSAAVSPRLEALAKLLPVFDEEKLQLVLTFGLPAVLCYTFVERPLRFGLSVGALLLASALSGMAGERTLHQVRSFFGVLKVKAGKEGEHPYHELIHGTTLHGKQFLDPESRGTALTYYHHTGPIGRVLAAYNRADRPVGVIGLGTGTLASYALPGQRFTFYDIDPMVRDLSFDREDYFSYVADARHRGADMRLVLGDARLTLQEERPTEDEKFGILAVDAFSSDAIPVHLITLEALTMLMDKVREDGIIGYHISNRYLDLRPVLANLAEKTGLVGYYMEDGSEREPGKSASTWVVLARKQEYLDRLRLTDRPDLGLLAGSPVTLLGVWKPLARRKDPKVGVWTDDYSNLLSVFMW